MNELSRKKARVLVVLSGGMDSTVCAALAVRDFGAENIAALHIGYGQRTEKRERRAFQEICDRLGIRTKLAIQTAFFKAIGGSALTADQISVLQAGREIGTEIPVTYVPFRNSHFLSAAVEIGPRCWGRRRFILGQLRKTVRSTPTAARSSMRPLMRQCGQGQRRQNPHRNSADCPQKSRDCAPWP
jgi:7-cyano-7-deazaguanine synthase